MEELDRALRTEARALGFGRIGVAAAGPVPHPERFEAWLAEGRHASMDWLADTREDRLDVRRLLPTARSVVVLGMDYRQPAPPDPGGLTGRVSAYAWGRDYHNLVGKRVRKLRARLQDAFPGLRGWVGVDSGPAWERAWAALAGVGFVGKNTFTIAPGDTSGFFLAVLVLNAELPVDAPLGDHCGSCRRCLDACPTRAFVGPYRLDAGRCISYLTIEHDGPVAPDLARGMGRWLFGCDDCQDVCPHVRRTPGPVDADFAPRHAWLELPELLDAPDDALVARFTGTPIRRAAPRRLRRSAAIVLGNLDTPAARRVLDRHRADRDPWVREAVAAALDRSG